MRNVVVTVKNVTNQIKGIFIDYAVDRIAFDFFHSLYEEERHLEIKVIWLEF